MPLFLYIEIFFNDFKHILQFSVWICYICCAKIIPKYFILNPALASENFKIIFPIFGTNM